MEGIGGFSFSNIGSAAKKRRSSSSRRPRNDTELFPDYRDPSSLSSTPPSDNISKGSSEENTGNDTSSQQKELNLNQLNSNVSSLKNTGASSGGSNETRATGSDFRRLNKGVLTPANWNGRYASVSGRVNGSSSSGQSGIVSDGVDTENKVKKVKLKVGGVTRTIHAKSTLDGAPIGGSFPKSNRMSDAPRSRQKLILQESSDEDASLPDRGSGFQGASAKDLSSRGRVIGESGSVKQTELYEPVRKSKRVPKRRSIDGVVDEDDDAEIRYLEKLKTSKMSANYGVNEDDEEGGKKHRISRVLKRHDDRQYNLELGSGKDAKRSRLGRTSEDIDYMDEEDLVSDDEPETKKKKSKREYVSSLADTKKEMAVTTRQRALLTGKDVSSTSGASLIEFPNGLPPPPPRKQKEQLSEVEQQLKRAEALQRRRMQVEKAARESEAEAIRKILGQDSSRKKREDKIKKRQEELAQEKATNAMILASDTVRWNFGPTGTVVTFPDEMGLPSIFNAKPCSYPPPREKCAGPSCVNPYKYRDSKSKLPLCSLQCYKAIHEDRQPVSTC